MNWEVVIGLETHAQLSTRSKIFSGASTAFGAAPNTQASVVDLALPGVLPVLNRGAVERAIRFGLAVNAKIAPHSIFARKNYFYPDLPKGYQISQFEIPVVQGGQVSFVVTPKSGEPYVKTLNLTRAHLEEDAGKSLHEDFHGMSGIDLNRAGTPLLEIVTEPELRSSAEAVAYARTLHSLVMWLGICDGNMQEGSFRCDANVSVRPAGQKEFGTRCEIKNLNSFKFLQAAIDYEVRRQIELIEDGGKVVQATRLYDPDRDETREMRTKEDAMDYRYFPDPDLLPLAISPEWIERVKGEMPELPEAMRERFMRDYGFPEAFAFSVTTDRRRAEHFDEFWKSLNAALPETNSGFDEARIRAANWFMVETGAILNQRGCNIWELPASARQLGLLVARIVDGTLTHPLAKQVLAVMVEGDDGGDPDAIIEARGLKQISDTGAIEALIDEVLAANAKMVDEFRAGKEKAFNALVGQAMRATKGKANPAQVNEILRKKLAG